MPMTEVELEEIRDAICDTHKCGPNCPNRRAEIDNWDGCRAETRCLGAV